MICGCYTVSWLLSAHPMSNITALALHGPHQLHQDSLERIIRLWYKHQASKALPRPTQLDEHDNVAITDQYFSNYVLTPLLHKSAIGIEIQLRKCSVITTSQHMLQAVHHTHTKSDDIMIAWQCARHYQFLSFFPMVIAVFCRVAHNRPHP